MAQTSRASAIVNENKSPIVLSAKDHKILELGVRIGTDVPTFDETQYLHSTLCQVGLPRSRVDGNQFERRSGDVALLIEAGKLWDGQKFVQQMIPYGAMPRLMLAWMNTFAVKNRTPIIQVGDSASEFLRMLGKDTSGGKKGTFTAFRKQIQALSSCKMTLGYNVDGYAHTYNGNPVKQFDAWLHDGSDVGQRSLWPGVIVFSEEYFQTLCSHAVPLDLRALMALQGSSLALDVYCWLAERLHRIHGRPFVLYWTSLREQFGKEYLGKDPNRDFKKKFLHVLKAVQLVYPGAKVEQVNKGIRLQHSSPPVPYRR